MRQGLQVSCVTLKLLRAILCVLACVLARGLRRAAWSPLACRSSPSFRRTVAPWAATTALPARSGWAMPANFGNSFSVSGYSVNKLERERALAKPGCVCVSVFRVRDLPGQNLRPVTCVIGLHGSPALQDQLMIGHRLRNTRQVKHTHTHTHLSWRISGVRIVKQKRLH